MYVSIPGEVRNFPSLPGRSGGGAGVLLAVLPVDSRNPGLLLRNLV